MVVNFRDVGTEGLPRDSGGAPGRLRSVEQVSSPDRLGDGNSKLKNGQQVFTLLGKDEIAEKNLRKGSGRRG